MSRVERLKKIKEIINNKKISSQGELLDELRKKGYSVTQATVSRDMNHLRLVKARNHRQEEYYSVENMIKDGKIFTLEKFSAKFKDSVISARRANNVIVIKTYPGEAQGTAAVIDGMNFVEILGTVAGDDTIICVADNNDNAEKLIKFIQDKF
jgi:transcriptional regulator of arginine metabolism